MVPAGEWNPTEVFNLIDKTVLLLLVLLPLGISDLFIELIGFHIVGGLVWLNYAWTMLLLMMMRCWLLNG